MKTILSVDGGGIKGVFPAAFLASLEETLNVRTADYFDLIVGTSTGGIIALALGKGLTANEILQFYRDHGPSIFGGNRILRAVQRLGTAKYSQAPLRIALQGVFGDMKLGDSTKRLVIPSANLETGSVHIFKTQHHPRLQTDWRVPVVDVALATAAAPTYFPTHTLASGIPLVDGGVWANNPVGFAVVEALSILGWQAEDLRILSLGCTTEPLNTSRARHGAAGAWYWSKKIVDVFMSTQSSASTGIAQHLAGHQNVFRISPLVARSRFTLDRASEIESLAGLGASEARQALPRVTFFFRTPAEAFVPLVDESAALR
jgi:patatin-like phospholipase/acyl hydrolase